jgi:thiamine biosynthesis protein ThiI
MRRRILLHCPDIALKGRNRPDFQAALARNARCVIASLGLSRDARVAVTRGRLHVETDGLSAAEERAAAAALACVPGISSLGIAVWLPPAEMGKDEATFNWPLLEDTVTDMAQACHAPGRTFSVRVNRVHKALPVNSMAMERRLGAVIRERTGWDRVNLESPDREFQVAAYPDGLYVYPEKLQGIGGLPVGTLGRVVALLSGGIDSPVAAYLLAKRGCIVDALHVTAGTLSGFDPEQDKLGRLVRQLSRYTMRTRLYVVPSVHFDLVLRGEQSGYALVLFRRFLLRAADHLAAHLRVPALVIGDSLGQVASQTLENIVTATSAAERLVLRPLIGFNKQEIIAVARRIGTYEISVEPHKDCCMLLSRNPRTRSEPGRVAQLEAAVIPDYPALLDSTFAEMKKFEFECGRLKASHGQ